MTFWFGDTTRQLGSLELDLRPTGSDLRVLLCMDLNNVAMLQNALHLSDLSLDEFGGVGYSRLALVSKVFTYDGSLHRTPFDAADSVWASLAAGLRPIAGALVYRHASSGLASDHVPILWYDDGGFPFTPSGAPVTIAWNVAGLGTITAT